MDTYTFEDMLTQMKITSTYPGLDTNIETATDSLDDVDHPRSLFFPGCSFLNYALPLVAAVYDTLRSVQEVDGISILCCGKILDFESDNKNLRCDFEMKLCDSLVRAQVQRIVVACPNCFATLSEILAKDERCIDITIEALSSVLARIGYRIDDEMLDDYVAQMSETARTDEENVCLQVSIHDSCPDREYGVFAAGVRDLLDEVTVVELEHAKSHSRCCGSIARAAGKFDSANRLALHRAQEGIEKNSDILVCSCMSCANQLSQVVKDANNQGSSHPIMIAHYLELLYRWPILWESVGVYMKMRFLFDDVEKASNRAFIGLEKNDRASQKE